MPPTTAKLVKAALEGQRIKSSILWNCYIDDIVLNAEGTLVNNCGSTAII